MGDVKLALLLGAALGYAVLPPLTLGFLLMLPVALYMLVREGAAGRKRYLPLGPFLAAGAIVVLLSGGATLTGYARRARRGPARGRIPRRRCGSGRRACGTRCSGGT